MSERKRLLVADDDPDLLELLKIDLSAQGYEVALAADGKEALRMAMDQPFDLVLLDVMMPYIDGYHVAYELTNKLGSKAPRILMITSRNAVKEKGIALMSGAMEILQKPFDMSALHARIAKMLAAPAAS